MMWKDSGTRDVRCGSLADVIASAEKGPLSGVKRTLSLRTSATHPKAVVPLSRGRVEIDPESDQGIAVRGTAGGGTS